MLFIIITKINCLGTRDQVRNRIFTIINYFFSFFFLLCFKVYKNNQNTMYNYIVLTDKGVFPYPKPNYLAENFFQSHFTYGILLIPHPNKENRNCRSTNL